MAVNATAVWRVRPSGSNTNGGGYDAGISGAGTDYSQQNAAQASGTHGACSSGSIFVDSTANAFTSAMVGNAIYITGGGSTTGWYFVTGYTSASTVTLDRTPGTSTSGATWHLGGAWADPFVNFDSSVSPFVPGNPIYVYTPSSTPSSSSPDYTSSGYVSPPSGDQTNGAIVLANDPSTPAGGMPVLAGNLMWNGNDSWIYKNLWMVANGDSYEAFAQQSGQGNLFIGCVFDQNGYDVNAVYGGGNGFINCEITSSISARGTSISGGVYADYVDFFYGCNIHDCIGDGVGASGVAYNFAFNVFSKNGGRGLVLSAGDNNRANAVYNNTFDGNNGDGVHISTSNDLSALMFFNNIISNHTHSGTYGLNVVGPGSAAQGSRIAMLANFNTFYNNTTNYNGINAGANDTATSTNPYVGESTNNFTLTSTFKAAGATPSGPLPQKILGWNSSSNSGSPQDYISPGAIQPNPTGASTTVIVPSINRNIFMTEDQADGSSL